VHKHDFNDQISFAVLGIYSKPMAARLHLSLCDDLPQFLSPLSYDG